MNEQIKALMGQTLDEKFSGTWSTMDMQDLQKFAERFAEKIVQECAELIDNKVTITAAQTYDEVFVAKFDTKELCAKQIREPFGVEE